MNIYKAFALGIVMLSVVLLNAGIVTASSHPSVPEGLYENCTPTEEHFFFHDFSEHNGDIVDPPGSYPDLDGDGVVEGGDWVKWIKGCASFSEDEEITAGVPPPSEFVIRCITPDTGGLQLPTDMSAESALMANVGGTTTVVRAGLNNDGLLVLRSQVPFEPGTIIVITDNNNLEVEFVMDPNFTNGLNAWGCYLRQELS